MYRNNCEINMKTKLILCLALIATAILGNRVTAADERAAPKVKLRFVSADSEETDGQDGYGVNAVDGDPNTFWHTHWLSDSPALPHEIIIQLLPPTAIKGFAYLPRQDLSDH